MPLVVHDRSHAPLGLATPPHRAVGSVPLVGAPPFCRFVFEADHPNPALIPPEDITGVTVVLLTCSYRGKEFIRIGYYVNNEYIDEELRENNPLPPQLDK